MLSIHELRVFLAAAETENFSRAGRQLGISQPAVSMQIRGLENRLNIGLFRRSGRHIALTEAGRDLMPMARDLINRAVQIEERMVSSKGEVSGLLRLGCSPTAGKHILPGLLTGLRTQHPQVEISCVVESRHTVLEKLLSGKIHTALTSLHTSHKELDYQLFLSESIILIVPPDHPKAGGTFTLEELAKEAFILREEGSSTYEALRNGLSQNDISLDYLNTVVTFSDSGAVRMAVQSGLGVAFVPSMVASEALASGVIATATVKGMKLERTLYMVSHNERPASGAQEAFWTYAFAPENEPYRESPQMFSEPRPIG